MKFIDNENVSTEGMNLYRKVVKNAYYIMPLDIASEGEMIGINTLDGYERLNASEDFVIMIGVEGDVYPIPKELFDERYIHCEGSIPSLKSLLKQISTGGNITKEVVHKCILSKPVFIYARELDEDATLTLPNGAKNYASIGDYIACDYNASDHFYFINKNIFLKTYAKV